MRTKAGSSEDMWLFLVPLHAYARMHTCAHTHTPWQGPLQVFCRALPLLMSWQGVDKAHKTKSTWAWLLRVWAALHCDPHACCVDFAKMPTPPEPWGPPLQRGPTHACPAGSWTVNKIPQKELQSRSRYGINGCFHHLTPSLHSFGRVGQEAPPPPAGGQLVTVGHRYGAFHGFREECSRLHESVEARWPPPSPPASNCSPPPPLLAEAWFPGPRLNCEGLPTRLLQSLPLQ